MDGFWKAKIDGGEKAGLFKNVVYNTMLSGMEAEEPNEKEIRDMEREIMKMARKVLGRQ